MLIHLHTSAVADAASESATAGRSHAAVENLLIAHFEGNHVVSLLPDDAETLRATPLQWSKRAARALEHIDESYPQIAGLRADIPWSMELGLGASFPSPGAMDGDGEMPAGQGGSGEITSLPGAHCILRANLHAFERTRTASRAALLGENATDADLFQQLGYLRRSDRFWEGVEMVHDARGAGGSTFAPEYERLAATGHILLAIADTDMRHPKDGGGGTYHKLRVMAQRRPDYQRARPLPVRTAEGLIPLTVYKDAITALHGDQDQRLNVIARLEPLLRSAPADILRYAHFKDGVRLHQVENPKTKEEGAYWSQIARNAGRDHCTRPSTERCSKKEECKCYVVDALGDKALSDVVTWMKTRKSKRQLAKDFHFSERPELRDLADEVLAWGLALPPLLT